MTPIQLAQGIYLADMSPLPSLKACPSLTRKNAIFLFCLSTDSLYTLCSNLTSKRNTTKIYGDTRRACVAIIIRWRRGQYDRTPIDGSSKARNWLEFVQDKMVQRDGGYPEILYIRRAKRSGDP